MTHVPLPPRSALLVWLTLLLGACGPPGAKAPDQVLAADLHGMWTRTDEGRTLVFRQQDDYYVELAGKSDVFMIYINGAIQQAGTFSVVEGKVRFQAIYSPTTGPQTFENALSSFNAGELAIQTVSGVATYQRIDRCSPSRLSQPASGYGSAGTELTLKNPLFHNLALAFDSTGALHTLASYSGAVGEYTSSRETCGLRGYALDSGGATALRAGADDTLHAAVISARQQILSYGRKKIDNNRTELTSWTLEPLQPNIPIAAELRLALSAAGEPIIAALPADGVEIRLYRRAAGAWTTQAIKPAMSAQRLGLALDPQGKVHLMWAGQDGVLRYAIESEGFAPRVLQSLGTGLQQFGFAIDGAGRYHVAITPITNERPAPNVPGFSGVLRFSTLMYGVGAPPDLQWRELGLGYGATLAIDAMDRVHLVTDAKTTGSTHPLHVMIDQGAVTRHWYATKMQLLPTHPLAIATAASGEVALGFEPGRIALRPGPSAFSPRREKLKVERQGASTATLTIEGLGACAAGPCEFESHPGAVYKVTTSAGKFRAGTSCFVNSSLDACYYYDGIEKPLDVVKDTLVVQLDP